MSALPRPYRTVPNSEVLADRAFETDNPLAPARGILFGVLLGAVMWAGLIATVVWLRS